MAATAFFYGLGLDELVKLYRTETAISRGMKMVTKSYSLDFDGYWREPNIGGLLAKSGIYSVYSCTYDVQQKTVSIKKLIYIGEAANIRERIRDHERWDDWKRELGSGQQLCFNAAVIGPQSDRGGRRRR